MAATLDDVWAYFLDYDKDSFLVLACQGTEPSEADVEAFEDQAGFRLPDAFREFTMSALGGLYMEVREHLWPRAKPLDVGPFWSFLYGLKVFGIAEGIPDWLDIREQYREMRDAGHADLAPFLQVEGDADRYCFDRHWHVIKWDHELPEERPVIEMAFPELLLHEIADLEDRKRRRVELINAQASP
jgi:hypothetical protein